MAAPLPRQGGSGAVPAACAGLEPVAAFPDFKLGESYCYPNPAKQTSPTLHFEAGLADSLTLRIYDTSGSLLEERVLPGEPGIVDGR